MINLEKKWLEAVPWEAVVQMNAELCQKDEQPHGPNGRGYEAARQLWEQARQRPLRLREVLDVCRQLHQLAPFRFFNGNTVAAVTKRIVADELASLPPVQAQMVRSTVSHYVVGAIKFKELEDVCAHAERFRHRPDTTPSL